ncbi:MAG: hypothetical protein MJ193_02720, partial [Clostridia bacterium]|nr:hypothetical protein [Clostridia bacterium]
MLDKKTKFGTLNDKIKQTIYGIVFGGLAIFGTEWGIPMNGAQVNCRDGAVLIAGLMFGAPAGIIAGIIGGVERAIAITWGVGKYTVIACSVSTALAGFYSAALRKFMFEDKKPGFIISLAIGVVMEIFHLTMVFITNIDDPVKAMGVVKACTLPMVLANSLSVFVASIALSLLASGKNLFKKRTGQVRISQTIQGWLLGVVLVAFAVTTVFVGFLQNGLADEQTNSLLDTSLTEISNDIKDTSNNNLLDKAHTVATRINDSQYPLDEIPDVLDDYVKERVTNIIRGIALNYDISEISIANKEGIIIASTVEEFVGFDFHSGEQAREFLCLLGDTEEFVQEYGQITSDEKIYRKYSGLKTQNGFLQVGYDADLFQADIDKQIKTISKNRAVGNTGYILILDNQFNVISAPKNMEIESIDVAGIDIKENVTFDYELNGEKSFCCYRNVEGYYVVAVLPESEAVQSRDIAIYVNTFMEILVFAILFALIYLLIKKVV